MNFSTKILPRVMKSSTRTPGARALLEGRMASGPGVPEVGASPVARSGEPWRAAVTRGHVGRVRKRGVSRPPGRPPRRFPHHGLESIWFVGLGERSFGVIAAREGTAGAASRRVSSFAGAGGFQRLSARTFVASLTAVSEFGLCVECVDDRPPHHAVERRGRNHMRSQPPRADGSF